ncbi:MAG: hypothetical protein ACRYHA_11960 [Janthinobacterium lividum]
MTFSRLPQPGVAVSASGPDGARRADATAVPVFVGHTASGVHDVAPVDSFAAFRRRYCNDAAPEDASAVFYRTIENYFENGGNPCHVHSLGQRAAAGAFYRARGVAWERLWRDLPDATLVGFPEAGAIEDDDIDAWVDCWATLLHSMAQHRNLFALVDLPRRGATACAALQRLQGRVPAATLRFGAAYWPFVVTAYHPHGKTGVLDRRAVPPSGVVATVFQKTDATRGVWKAPANLPLAHVVAPDVDGRAALAAAARQEGLSSINLIRAFPGRGTRVWGCRTLQPDARNARAYVQGSRTMAYIEKSLADVCRFAVFEANDDITWMKLKGSAYAWLHAFWRSGGLAGADEDEAFQLAIGPGMTMTADDIAAGRAIVRIGLALQRPAEFIDLHFVLQSGELSRWDAAAQARP